jgi:CubicO group peptidase (beta-lactamase class C family)
MPLAATFAQAAAAAGYSREDPLVIAASLPGHRRAHLVRGCVPVLPAPAPAPAGFAGPAPAGLVGPAPAGHAGPAPAPAGLGLSARPDRPGAGTSAVGDACAPGSRRLTTSTLVYVASLAKQVTAAGAALLVRDRLLDIEAPLATYVDGLPAWARTVRLRHLVHHTSGLPPEVAPAVSGLSPAASGSPPGASGSPPGASGSPPGASGSPPGASGSPPGASGPPPGAFGGPAARPDASAVVGLGAGPPGASAARDRTTAAVLAAGAAGGLEAEPGSRFAYSNVGYVFLAAAIEAAARLSFAEFAQRRIFEPLGMADTLFWSGPDPAPPGAAPLDPVHPAPLSLGDGGMWSTAEDLLRWSVALDEDRLGITGRLQTPGRLGDGTETDYAWGMGVRTSRGQTAYRHGGSYADVRTMLVRVPERGFDLVILSLADRTERRTRLADALLA